MYLTPVSRRTPLSLDDRSAERPSELPDDDELKPKTKDLLKRLGELQATLYADARYAVLVVLQARDAGGKDGTVRTVFGACNPLGCAVTGFKRPTPIELSHDYLWRVHQAVPPREALRPDQRVRADARRQSREDHQVLPAHLA
jgi:polyphosphate kinase 2 (PPK2 family)